MKCIPHCWLHLVTALHRLKEHTDRCRLAQLCCVLKMKCCILISSKKIVFAPVFLCHFHKFVWKWAWHIFIQLRFPYKLWWKKNCSIFFFMFGIVMQFLPLWLIVTALSGDSTSALHFVIIGTIFKLSHQMSVFCLFISVKGNEFLQVVGNFYCCLGYAPLQIEAISWFSIAWYVDLLVLSIQMHV